MTVKNLWKYRVLVIDDKRSIHAGFRKVPCPDAAISEAIDNLEAE